MRHDLDILQELFLPLLEEVAAYSPRLAAELVRGEAFWVHFNKVVIDGGIALRQLLADYGVRDAPQAYAQCESLTAEYICCMAQDHCAGLTNPTIDTLLQNADARFAAEVSFQRDMLAAIAQVSRAELRAELETALAEESIADAEISAAFSAIAKTTAHDDLRSKLQQWDAEQPKQEEPEKRKRRITIPLLFLRVAAAAAVFTGGVVGVVSVYNSSNRDSMPAANTQSVAEAGSMAKPPAATDSTVVTNSGKQNTSPQQVGRIATGSNTNDKRKGAVTTDTAKVSHTDSSAYSAPATLPGTPARLPHISLRGYIAETQTGDTVYNVMVTLADDQGNKQTQLSKDGTFSFELAPHRSYFIIGRREHYRPVPQSLSTKNVKDTDEDSVMTITLKLEGDR